MNISNVLQYTSKRHYYHGPRNLIKDEVSNNKVDDPISYKHFCFNSLKPTDFSNVINLTILQRKLSPK